jgi:hypothetical protein
MVSQRAWLAMVIVMACDVRDGCGLERLQNDRLMVKKPN